MIFFNHKNLLIFLLVLACAYSQAAWGMDDFDLDLFSYMLYDKGEEINGKDVSKDASQIINLGEEYVKKLSVGQTLKCLRNGHPETQYIRTLTGYTLQQLDDYGKIASSEDHEYDYVPPFLQQEQDTKPTYNILENPPSDPLPKTFEYVSEGISVTQAINNTNITMYLKKRQVGTIVLYLEDDVLTRKYTRTSKGYTIQLFDEKGKTDPNTIIEREIEQPKQSLASPIISTLPLQQIKPPTQDSNIQTVPIKIIRAGPIATQKNNPTTFIQVDLTNKKSPLKTTQGYANKFDFCTALARLILITANQILKNKFEDNNKKTLILGVLTDISKIANDIAMFYNESLSNRGNFINWSAVSCDALLIVSAIIKAKKMLKKENPKKKKFEKLEFEDSELDELKTVNSENSDFEESEAKKQSERKSPSKLISSLDKYVPYIEGLLAFARSCLKLNKFGNHTNIANACTILIMLAEMAEFYTEIQK